MSQASHKISVRIDKTLMAEVSDYLLSRNCQALTPPWSLSEFVQHAIMDKLDHIKRSRRKRTPPVAMVVGEFDGVDMDYLNGLAERTGDAMAEGDDNGE